jgi:hypothetical protein
VHALDEKDGNVLISRRGLTAAGLALAVVGGMGVTSTLTAGAAQIAGPRPGAITPGPAAALMTPPPPLPGAGVARKSSAVPPTVAAAAPGSDAGERAPAAGQHNQAFAPKGMPDRIPAASGKAGSRFSAQVQSPEPPAGPAVPGHGAVYFYAQASQEAVAEGTYATMTIGKPTVGKGAYHSLAEIIVQTERNDPTERDRRTVEHAVEVGWIVNPALFKDNRPHLPHLFVHYWVDGQRNCYNCDFVPYDPQPEPTPSSTTTGSTTAASLATPSIRPGAVLPVGESKRFGIQRNDGAWWVSYDEKWIGYFPDSLWQGRFTRTEVVQWWGEVATSRVDKPCAEMGTGLAASEPGAAEIRRINLLGGPALNIGSGTRGNFYSVKQVGKNAISFGGKGPCPA